MREFVFDFYKYSHKHTHIPPKRESQIFVARSLARYAITKPFSEALFKGGKPNML